MPEEPSTFPPLADGLPGTTEALLRQLDHCVKKPALDVSALCDERVRLELAFQVGRRDLVNQLLAIHRRQKEEQS